MSEPHDWLVEIDGDAPVVVYAPHGGRRAADAGRGANVNDLHTDELSLEIARRLGASAIINRGLDRNEHDLNRISTLRSTRSDVLSRLDRVIDVATRGGQRTALVLLVHGWNISSAWCDIGVGLTESAGELRGRNPTVSRAVLDRVCLPLIDRLRAAGLEGSIGHRYAASGKENVTQIFSGRHAEDDDEIIARLSQRAAAGALDGIQIELGIPLRWPGPRRDRLIEVLCAVLEDEIRERENAEGASATCPRTEWDLPPRQLDRPADRPEPGYAVQAVLADGSGLFLGAEPGGARSLAARVCIARPDGRMALFVAEGPWNGDPGSYAVAGLRFEASENRRGDREFAMRLEYDGPMVLYPTHDAFLDLERGLAGADIQDASLRLEFTPHSGGFGRLTGSVSFGPGQMEVAATAVCNRGGRLDPAADSRLRVHITEGPRAPEVLADAGVERDPKLLLRDGRLVLPAGSSEAGSDEAGSDSQARDSPDKSGRGEIHATVRARVPVFRILPDGTAIRVTFGVAEFEGTSEDSAGGVGLFEEVSIIRPRGRQGSPGKG